LIFQGLLRLWKFKGEKESLLLKLYVELKPEPSQPLIFSPLLFKGLKKGKVVFVLHL